MYRKQQSLTVGNFMHSGVFVAFVDATIIFFIPFYAMVVNGQHSTTDFWSLGNVRVLGMLCCVCIVCVVVSSIPA